MINKYVHDRLQQNWNSQMQNIFYQIYLTISPESTLWIREELFKFWKRSATSYRPQQTAWRCIEWGQCACLLLYWNNGPYL